MINAEDDVLYLDAGRCEVHKSADVVQSEAAAAFMWADLEGACQQFVTHQRITLTCRLS
jgi:hypothetical protein